MVNPPRKPTGRVMRIVPSAPVDTPEDSLLERIEEELKRAGVNLFNNENVDIDYLVLPMDLTEVPSLELGKYLNAFTQQKMWTRTLIGRVSAMQKETSRDMDRVRSREFSKLAIKLSLKEKELSLANNMECAKFIDDLDFYQQKLHVLADYLENIVDAIFNISREITRSASDFGDDARNHNIGSFRKPTGRRP